MSLIELCRVPLRFSSIVLAVLLLLVPASHALGQPATPDHAPNGVLTFKGDIARTGVQAGPPPKGKPSIKWQTQMIGGAGSSPAVSDGFVFIGGRDNAVHAFDAMTGDEVWAYPTESFVISSPTIEGDAVIIGCNDGSVYSIDRVLGTLNWKADLRENDDDLTMVLGAPAVANGVVYVAAERPDVFALDLKTGETLWTTDLALGEWSSVFPGVNSTSPALANGLIYISVGSVDDGFSGLYALNGRNGRLEWMAPTKDNPTTPAVIGTSAYLFASDTLYAIDAITGAELWTVETGSRIDFVDSSPAVLGNNVFFSDGGYLYSIDTTTGAEVWRTVVNAESSPPAIIGNLVIIGGYDAILHAVLIDSGEEAWAVQLDSRIQASAAVVNGVIYVPSGGEGPGGLGTGFLYALES